MLLQEYVQKKAYYRWLKRGAFHGNDLADWLEAERSLPKRIWVGWKPSRTTGGYNYDVLVPGLPYWEDLFLSPRVQLSDGVWKTYVTHAWLDEPFSAHTNGEPGVEFLPPQPFPSVEELSDRNVTIRFHGPVLIRWDLYVPHGKLESIQFMFMRHPDTILEEIPRVIPPQEFRCSYGTIEAFRKGIDYLNSAYNREGWARELLIV